jgi:transcriptional regulator with PAS, ATPase and Fis domain
MTAKTSTNAPAIIESVIEAVESPFVVIDNDYTIIAANSAYHAAYAVSADEIIGRKCHKISHHSDLPCHLNGEDCPHKKVFESGKPHEVLHTHYDHNNEEEHVRIKGTPIRAANGKLYLGEAVFPLTKSDELGCDQQRMLGKSAAFLNCVDEMSGAASSDTAVLLKGESGVGKELAAQFIHKKSGRAAGPFIDIDCTAISEGIFESELFGHERGAFTGCIGRRHGLIESADSGTLFLDEIAELPFTIQGRLLRALETGFYRRLGSREDMHVDVRVICATQHNLLSMIEQGTFRADLYYRIAGITIIIPPLRERHGDLAPLVNAIVAKKRNRNGQPYKISDAAMELLEHYSFPGNIRELKNILQKAISLSTSGLITPDLLKFDDIENIYHGNPVADRRTTRGARKTPPSTNRSISEIEATHIESLLHQYKGHRAKVAEVLDISARTLYRKLKQYNLTRVGKQHT